ncbi:TniQ family protein, partial [Micrococcus porci]|uniref:TniQ family protein n=1 Tax=Micrococcus porci TaxID=2856555 RepID=UPI003CF56054
MSTLLPIRPRPAPEEALDSYLERVATANGVTTSGFVRQLTTEARAPLRFTNIAPPPPILDVLASWTGTDRGLLRDCRSSPWKWCNRLRGGGGLSRSGLQGR